MSAGILVMQSPVTGQYVVFSDGGYGNGLFGGDVPGWTPEVTGDFTGAPDSILWRSASGGALLWNSNGAGGYRGQNLGTVPTSWQIAGTGDITGVGEDSILWRNANGDTELWNPTGTGSFTGRDLGVVSTNWQIEGIGDFNDARGGVFHTGVHVDGILWRNTANGDVDLWNNNGSGSFSGQDLGVVGSNWNIIGTANLNGQGDSIVWEDGSGDVEAWEPNGSGGFTGQSLGSIQAGYELIGSGDYTNTGTDGLLWRNNATSADIVWLANGSGGFNKLQPEGVVEGFTATTKAFG